MTTQQHLAFDQPIARPPRARHAVRERGMTDIGQSAESKVHAWGTVYRATRHPIVEAMNANAPSAKKIGSQSIGEVAAVSSRYVGTFSDMRPTSALDLDRIRTLLSKGLLRDARSVVAEALKKFPRDESLYALARLTAPQKATRLAARFPRRDQEFRWLDEHRDDYKGKWVALLGNNLIASANTMKQVLDAVAEKHVEGTPLVHKVE